MSKGFNVEGGSMQNQEDEESIEAHNDFDDEELLDDEEIDIE